MWWRIALATLVGGCSQLPSGVHLITTSSLGTPDQAQTAAAPQPAAVPAPVPATAVGPANTAATPVKAAAVPVLAAQPAAAAGAAAQLQTTTASTAPTRVRGAERVSGNLYRVMANDLKLSNPTDRENYALLKAAETTIAAGGTHFVLVTAGDQGATGIPSLTSLTNGGAPDYGAYFRVLQVEPGMQPPIGAMAATEIVHFFGPKFSRAPS